MTTPIDDVLDDLVAEYERLESILDSLSDAQWRSESGAPGWSVTDVMIHLAQTEEAVVATTTRPDEPNRLSRDGGTLELDGDDVPGRLGFDHAILATGSVPIIPPALQSDDERVMDSTTALDLPVVPRRLLVVGGGYVGLELGTVYAELGAKITVVEMTGNLLPGVDPDLVQPLEGGPDVGAPDFERLQHRSAYGLFWFALRQFEKQLR